MILHDITDNPVAVKVETRQVFTEGLAQAIKTIRAGRVVRGDGLVLAVEAGDVVGAGEDDALHAVEARRFVEVVGADDVGLQEITGADGGPISIASVNLKNLTDEERRVSEAVEAAKAETAKELTEKHAAELSAAGRRLVGAPEAEHVVLGRATANIVEIAGPAEKPKLLYYDGTDLWTVTTLEVNNPGDAKGGWAGPAKGG